MGLRLEEINVPNNAKITTLEVFDTSYLKNTQIDGTLKIYNVDINLIYQKRPWVHASINVDGSIEMTKGLYPLTNISRSSTLAGYWTISWNQPHPSGANYIPELSLPETFGFVYHTSRTSTSMSIITTNSLTDSSFRKLVVMIPNH